MVSRNVASNSYLWALVYYYTIFHWHVNIREGHMRSCLHQDIDDICELWTDLDKEDVPMLYCTEEGECCVTDPDLEECPFYIGVWE